MFAAARRRIAQAQARWPGLDAVETGGELRLAIPEEFRVGHEAHFAQVAQPVLRVCARARFHAGVGAALHDGEVLRFDEGRGRRAFGSSCAIIHLSLFVFRRGRARPDRAQRSDKEGVLPDFYEFFAGGGMARAGLGPDWRLPVCQ